MSNMCSVLNNKPNIKLAYIPYPYLIIDNALPTKYYEKLNQTFPAYDKIIKSDIINGAEYKENFAYRSNASQSLTDNEIPNIWKEFITIIITFR